MQPLGFSEIKKTDNFEIVSNKSCLFHTYQYHQTIEAFNWLIKSLGLDYVYKFLFNILFGVNKMSYVLVPHC